MELWDNVGEKIQLNIAQVQAVQSSLSSHVAIDGTSGTGKTQCILARTIYLCQQLPTGTPLAILLSSPTKVGQIRLALEHLLGVNHLVGLPLLLTCCPEELVSYPTHSVLVDDFFAYTPAQQEVLFALPLAPQGALFLTGDSTGQLYSLEERVASLWQGDVTHLYLHQNHRTDCGLLTLFDGVFHQWDMPFYPTAVCGTRHYNHYAPWLVEHPQSFFHQSTIGSEEMRMAALIEEIQRIHKRLTYEEEQSLSLPIQAQTIAILTHTTQQCIEVRKACQRSGLSIFDGTPLPKREAATDLYALLSAACHPHSLLHLYQLLECNLFHRQMPKSNLYVGKSQLRKKGASQQEIEQLQLAQFTQWLNEGLPYDCPWDRLVHQLHTNPLPVVLEFLYNHLQPWSLPTLHTAQYQGDFSTLLSWVEQVPQCTPFTITEQLRTPTAPLGVDNYACHPLSCLTLAQASGLEFGHVLAPYCSTYQSETGDALAPKKTLYHAMSTSIRSFSWISLCGTHRHTWQQLLKEGAAQ